MTRPEAAVAAFSIAAGGFLAAQTLPLTPVGVSTVRVITAAIALALVGVALFA